MSIIKKFLEDAIPKFVKPTNKAFLGTNWFWEMYPDGSGSLERKTKKGYETYFTYDKKPYLAEGGIEYDFKNKEHGVYVGSFEDFIEFAEEQVANLI